MKDGSVDKGRSTLTEDQSSVPNTHLRWLQKSVTLTSTDHIIPPHTHTFKTDSKILLWLYFTMRIIKLIRNSSTVTEKKIIHPINFIKYLVTFMGNK